MKKLTLGYDLKPGEKQLFPQSNQFLPTFYKDHSTGFIMWWDPKSLIVFVSK